MKNILLFVLLAMSAIAATTPPSAQFLARRDYNPGATVVRVADVNGDKIPDIVEIDGGYTNQFTILLGSGNGLFHPGPKLETGLQTLSGLELVDLNGDGKVDIIVSGSMNGLNGIGVCLGNGDGTFQPAVFYEGNAGYLEMGDFHGDGILDAVVTARDGVWLFTGKGGGVFNPGVLTPLTNMTEGSLPSAFGVADFNADGHLDLAVSFNYHPAGSAPVSGFYLLLGNGDGTFQAPVTYNVRPCGQYQIGVDNWIAVADLNKDGHPDIVLSPIGNGTFVNVLLNNGNGGFSTPTQANMNCSCPITIGDVNGDGIPDLVNSLGDVAFGEGNGKFRPPLSYAVEGNLNTFDVILAELHQKGILDIVAAQYMAVSVLLNRGKGSFEDGEWIPVQGAGSCGAAADFNGDGKPDLAVPTGNGIVILLGTGNAVAPYTTGATIPMSGAGCPITGDLNGDGIPDILVGANSLGGVGAYLGNGDGTFTLKGVSPVGPGVIVTGDFNHDGKLDFADSTNQLALGNGDGTFQVPVNIVTNPPALGYSWLAAGDINNDGWTDILLTPAGDFSYFAVLVNNQQGGFTQTLITNGTGPQGVALADLNMDGNLDAVIWPVGLNNAEIYLGDGKGGFTLQKQAPKYPGLDTIMLSIGDVNGDGIPDLLLPADGSLGIAYGNGCLGSRR
jgi:hypothetical protein